LLNGKIRLTNGNLELSIANKNEIVWKIDKNQNREFDFQNEIIELSDTGKYKITISLTNASGYYNINWKEASSNLKKSNQKYDINPINKNLIEKISDINDSIKVGNITIKNLFKYQILAHIGSKYDSNMIVKNVYQPHKSLWDNCYGMIFGEENASKFNTPEGMIGWNKILYPENKAFFDERIKELLNIDLNSTLKTNLKKFADIVPYKPQATISILFTPLQGIGFGGCSNNQFCFELNNTDYEVAYTIEKGIPHELNHFAYEPLRENDPMKGTALFLTIDEGLACYFTWFFFNGQITKHEAVENMSESDWNWYLKNEKQLFTQLKPYFKDKSGDNPLLRNDNHQLFKDAPKTLYYWLGFRIIEKYVEKNGLNSWKDVYKLDVSEVLEKSGYEEYIALKK